MSLLLAACLLVRIDGSSTVSLASGETVGVTWTAGAYPGNSGDVIVSVKRRAMVSRVSVRLPADSWTEADVPARPAALLSLSPTKHEAILDLTLSVASGVYGYRRVLTYKVSPSGKTLLQSVGKPIEFSDFGSWRRLGHDTVEVWDALPDPSLAHHAPHRYILTRLTQLKADNKVLHKKKTKHSYAVTWSSEPKSQVAIPVKNDPLRELGSRWTWWGEPWSKPRRGK